MSRLQQIKSKIRKWVKLVVELDQFKAELNAYEGPLVEVRIHFDLANKEQRIEELERKMEEPISGMCPRRLRSR